MTPALPLLLALALGVDARVESALRAEVRGRRVTPAPTPPEARALDLSASPRLLLRLQEGLAALDATYAPRFTSHDVGPDARFEHMHEGELRLRLERPRAYRLELFAGGAAGRTDLLSYSRTPAGGGGTGAITTTRTVDLERLRGGAQLAASLDRRSEITASAVATVEGGVNAASRVDLPVTRSLEGAAEYLWSATRVDRFGLRLHGFGARVAARHADSSFGDAMVTWHRRFDRQLELWAGAGAVHLRSRVPDAAAPGTRRSSAETRAAAELGLARAGRPPVPPSVDGAAEAAPAAGEARGGGAAGLSADALVHLGAGLDRLTGVASPQLDATASLRWPLTWNLALLARASGSLIWPDTGRTRRGQIELGAAHTTSSWLSLDAGIYGARQVSTDPGLPDYSEYGAFVGLNLAARPLTF